MTKSKKPVSQNVENDHANIDEVVDPAQLGLGLEGGTTAPPPTPQSQVPPMTSEKLRQAIKLDLDAACAFLHMIKMSPEIQEEIAVILEKHHKAAGPLIDHMKVQK